MPGRVARRDRGGADGGDHDAGDAQVVRDRARHQGREPRDPEQGVRRLRRAVGLRQVDPSAPGRRARGHHRRAHDVRRRGGQRPAAGRARHRDGVPVLRALPAHERLREHGLRPQARQGRHRRASTSGSATPRASCRSSTCSSASPRRSPAASASASRSAARSCATREVFLFDEPLSNLDAALRVQMRIEIAKLHHELDATMIYVTHDQVEAMTLADRIVVLNAGVVEQFGIAARALPPPATTCSSPASSARRR